MPSSRLSSTPISPLDESDQKAHWPASRDNPTQWLFKGLIPGAEHPLQVAVARLCGYAWPEQAEDGLGKHIDPDGIVCLPAVAGEPDAASRLRALLTAAYGDSFRPALVDELLADAGAAGKTLEEWLWSGFFAQHCKVFGDRPLVWHIWDGHKSGFSAFVNYHQLTKARLEKLTYTVLGAWIERQRAEARDEKPGADTRLAKALALQDKLKLILEGEPPYDIYVRWKLLAEQPLGWDPDLDDGVRLNIRPFVQAGVLRSKVNVHWKKDRGKDPDGSERINDRHVTLTDKRAARDDLAARPASEPPHADIAQQLWMEEAETG